MIAQNEPDYGEREIEAVHEYLKSGYWLTEYKQTREFERLFAEFLCIKHAVAVPSGTVALALAIIGLGVRGEVLVPDYSIIASATSVELAGAVPVLVDVEKATHCMDPGAALSAINNKTEAIMIVPNNGRSPNSDLFQIARRYNLAIIEDSCQCLGSKYGDRYFGTLGNVGCFSLSHHKIVTTGQGGMIVTDDTSLYERISRLKNYGRTFSSGLQEYGRPGYNFKFNDILASFGIAQMRGLNERLDKKRAIYRMYLERLGELISPLSMGNLISVIDILVEAPDILSQHLRAHEIESRLFYPPIHNYFPELTDACFPNATFLREHGLWLPSSTKLASGDVDFICEVIQNCLE